MDFQKVFYDTNDFTITDKNLGKGVFGTVYIAERKADKMQCAAKVINILSDIDGKDQMMIMRESFILSKLNHPSIVKYYGVNFRSLKDQTKFSPTILTEYMVNKSLKQILDNEESSNSPHDWNPTKKYICLLGISNAMKYLHEQEILHRDLKPENILIDGQFYPKVCDFGLSRCLPKLLSSSMKKSLTGKVGTPLYMAPELLDEDEDNKVEYGKGVDVYAFAMLAYEIVTGKKPFYENGKQITVYKHYEMVMNGERPKFTQDVPEKMKTLIEKCWSQKAEDRPSFNDIFNTLSSDFTLSPEEVDADEINDYLEMLKEKTDDKNKFKKENNQFQEQIDKLKDENNKIKNLCDQLKIENNQYKTQIDKLKIENNQYKEQIDKFEIENNQYKEQIDKFEIKNNQYKDQIDKLQIENDQFQRQINQLKGENKSLQYQVDQNTNENNKLKNDQKSLNDMISQLKEKINKISFDKDKEINDLKILIEKLQNNIKINEEKLETSQRKLQNLFSSNEEFSRAMNSIFGTRHERKMKSAISYLKISSDKGNCYASYLLGILYESGEGIEKDSSQMINYYQKSSEQGNSHGYNRIGYCYDIGHVLQNNYSKAYEYYSKAEKLGNSYAINNIGVLYWNGRCVEKNKTKAVEQYQKSADLGNSYALRNLAKLYAKGNFFKQDYAKAIDYFLMSAEKVDSTAYIYLGDLYVKGDGVGKNLQKAKEYYQKAKDLDDPDAIKKLKSIS